MTIKASLIDWASALFSPSTFNAASKRKTRIWASAARSSGLNLGCASGAGGLRPCGARGPVGCLDGARPWLFPPGFLAVAVDGLCFNPRCHTPGGGRVPPRIVLHTASDKLCSDTHFRCLPMVCRDSQTAQQATQNLAHSAHTRGVSNKKWLAPKRPKPKWLEVPDGVTSEVVQLLFHGGRLGLRCAARLAPHVCAQLLEELYAPPSRAQCVYEAQDKSQNDHIHVLVGPVKKVRSGKMKCLCCLVHKSRAERLCRMRFIKWETESRRLRISRCLQRTRKLGKRVSS